MDKKPLPGLWDGLDVPPFEDLLRFLDVELMESILGDMDMAILYHWFNSPTKPLGPREFIHFWKFLTEEEKLSMERQIVALMFE